VLDTDAYDIGLGAVLQQEQPDGLRVISYASRALSKAELSYCTTKKEVRALTDGLEVFCQYLLPRQFLLRSDHAALTHLRRTPEPIGQQARRLDLIAEFNFTIQHSLANRTVMPMDFHGKYARKTVVIVLVRQKLLSCCKNRKQ